MALLKKKPWRAVDKIGITARDEKPDGLPSLGRRGTHCNMIAKAREGRVFYAESVNYSCEFAKYTLGLTRDASAFERFRPEELLGIKNALKTDVPNRILEATPQLPEGNKYMVFFPLKEMPLEPDVVVLIGRPVDIMDIVWEITTRTGERIEAHIGAIGAMCGELTVAPLVTGKPNLSVGCCGSRRFGKLQRDEIMLSLPWAMYRQLFDGAK
ncbi:MAG: DUF169 domain-containing protein [Candidatus Abyssubacteria bacterium]